jgi:kynureninase
VSDPLLRWRAEFPILAKTTYLVSHSLGAMPRAARERLGAYADAWAERGVRAWAEGWWRMPVSTGDKIARIIGAPAGSVVMHQNVSVCQALVLSCFDFRGKRNKIVYDELNFPSVMYVYEAQRAQGARVEVVPSPDGISVPLERLLAAIDEQTLLVPVSHVLFKSAFVQDMRAITRRAHEVGALVVADLYQSTGTVPVDVTAWDVDFATGGSVKWLCGGPGAGYLYVAPRLRERLEPRLTGWMAHERPFAFEAGPVRYATDATRFLHGSPAIPALYAAEAGYDIVNQIGVDAIRAKSVRQVQRLIELARERGLATHTPEDPEQRGGMVILDVPHGEAVARELIRREILIDYRPGAGIRLSPHFYTSDEELTHAVDEICAILAAGPCRNPDAAVDTPF